jgi:hypothetical protein
VSHDYVFPAAMVLRALRGQSRPMRAKLLYDLSRVFKCDAEALADGDPEKERLNRASLELGYVATRKNHLEHAARGETLTGCTYCVTLRKV